MLVFAAVLGALTGTLSLCWQMARWWRERRPLVRVVLAMTATMHKSLPPRVYSKAEVESVMIRVTNESNFPIRVVNAGLILQELSKGEMTFGQLLNGPLPKDF